MRDELDIRMEKSCLIINRLKGDLPVEPSDAASRSDLPLAGALFTSGGVSYRITVEYILNCYSMSAHRKADVLDEHTAAHVSELFRAFSDSSRVRILSALLQRELNVSALADLVGITKSAVSHHLRGLRQLRLVRARRAGKEVFYSVVDPHIVQLFVQVVEHLHTG